MNGNLSHALGFILGVTLITGIIVAMLMFFTSRDKKLKRKYDERQELIRGKAFKYAFYTVITMNMIYSVADISFDRIPVDPSVAGFIMAIFGVGVYAWYCIFNGAYFALNDKIKETVVCLSLIGLLNIGIGIMELAEGGVVKDGVLTFKCINLVAGIFMMVTVLVILIKQHLDKKEV